MDGNWANYFEHNLLFGCFMGLLIFFTDPACAHLLPAGTPRGSANTPQPAYIFWLLIWTNPLLRTFLLPHFSA